MRVIAILLVLATLCAGQVFADGGDFNDACFDPCGDTCPSLDPDPALIGWAQDLTNNLHGKILRIDTNVADVGTYAIPVQNPFVGKVGDDEIWAYGFREPWQFSFDEPTGDLWLGDVGQVTFEEVSIVRKGENHGWNVEEAFDGFSDEYRRPNEMFTPPVFAYSRKLGTSITGGRVYRADKNSPLYGYYIRGDHESRRHQCVLAWDRLSHRGSCVSVLIRQRRTPCHHPW